MANISVKKLKKELISKLSKKIWEETKGLDLTFMHLCGTHEDTVTRFNLRSLLPNSVRLLSGPGCPVCIIPDKDLQMVFHLLEKEDLIFTTFGDMARVPYDGKSLFFYRSKGYDIRIVYSIFDALKIAKNSDKDVVHFGIGFETTMPSTALAVLDAPENFRVFSSHRFFIPAMEYLLSLGEMKIDGLINPGHVSTITGVKAYEGVAEKYRVPQVISGFEPEDVLLSVLKLIRLVKMGEGKVENEYERAVTYEGNLKAQQAMDEVFGRENWEWRGLGVVPNSGAPLKDKFSDFDAFKVYEDVFESFEYKEDKRKQACRCGEVLRGLITPAECPLFNKACNPKEPIGPCMVSFEGTCNIWAKYGNLEKRLQ
ncbi:MAG: hydrogenase formation protein HypD [Archaeoglobus sp.]|nr:hydrogenase formation protein HypD [Archaeoglobus sp.]